VASRIVNMWQDDNRNSTACTNIVYRSTTAVRKQFFYRSTLCVSAVLTIRRWLSVCLSLRPLHWCIVSKRLKI